MHTRTRGISEAFRVTLYALIALSTTAARPIEIAPEERPYPAPVITERGTQLGLASWYGPGFHGRHTAGGEVYDQEGLTAAHRSLPLGTIIEVTNRESHARVRLRVNDRGPYHRHRVLAEATRAGIEAIGLRLLAPDAPSPAATGFWLPEGIDGGPLGKHLRDTMGVTVAGGQGHLKGKIMRLAHIGYADTFDVIVGLSAIEMALAEFGRGAAAAQKLLNREYNRDHSS